MINGLERSKHINGLERSKMMNGLERNVLPLSIFLAFTTTHYSCKVHFTLCITQCFTVVKHTLHHVLQFTLCITPCFTVVKYTLHCNARLTTVIRTLRKGKSVLN